MDTYTTWKETPITEVFLGDYLFDCDWQDWTHMSQKQAVELVKEEMNHMQCELSDEKIFEIIKEWIKDGQQEAQQEDDSWQRERAMLAGMAHGVQAYNDIMGYSESEYSCYSCGDRGCQYCDY